MGTVEPHYNDEQVFLKNENYIYDDALAFIYGAIKKYGTNREYDLNELKEYIIKEAQYIGKN